jgi:hypothetical protein
MSAAKNAGSTLTETQRESARVILEQVRTEITKAADGDPALAFALRRYIYVRLSHDERSSPMQRRALKMRKFDAQRGQCAICHEPLSQIGHSHLHRHDAVAGYTDENTSLVHGECHRKQQAARNYS